MTCRAEGLGSLFLAGLYAVKYSIAPKMLSHCHSMYTDVFNNLMSQLLYTVSDSEMRDIYIAAC